MDISQIFNRQSTLKLNEYECAIVIGLGGVGSWAALMLALSGTVRRLIIIDPDTIEESNLNRTLFRLQDIGSYKVDVVKYLILERRATCEIENYRLKTNTDEFLYEYENNIYPKIKDSDGLIPILDCRDNIYEDMFNNEKIFKRYKVGYDGLSVTFDPDPNKTEIWGDGDSYRVVPSFLCPAMFIAYLAVNHILTWDFRTDPSPKDLITIDTKRILKMLYIADKENKGR